MDNAKTFAPSCRIECRFVSCHQFTPSLFRSVFITSGVVITQWACCQYAAGDGIEISDNKIRKRAASIKILINAIRVEASIW